jgi:hypothetical protein
MSVNSVRKSSSAPGYQTPDLRVGQANIGQNCATPRLQDQKPKW